MDGYSTAALENVSLFNREKESMKNKNIIIKFNGFLLSFSTVYKAKIFSSIKSAVLYSIYRYFRNILFVELYILQCWAACIKLIFWNVCGLLTSLYFSRHLQMQRLLSYIRLQYFIHFPAGIDSVLF